MLVFHEYLCHKKYAEVERSTSAFFQLQLQLHFNFEVDWLVKLKLNIFNFEVEGSKGKNARRWQPRQTNAHKKIHSGRTVHQKTTKKTEDLHQYYTPDLLSQYEAYESPFIICYFFWAASFQHENMDNENMQ